MSSLATPRGPLPARVYWTRRLVVLAVAVLLLVTLGRVLTGGSDGKGSGSGDKAAQVAGTPTSSQSTGQPTGAARGSAAPGTTKPRAAAGGDPLAEPKGACDPEKVSITPKIGKRANDGHVELAFLVGTSEEACTFTFSQRTVVLKITSGSDSIWSSQQCRTLPRRDLVVRSAKQAGVEVVWSGRRSDAECSNTAGWAVPGYYHAVVAALGGEPTDRQFQLTGPPGVVVTRTASPTPGPAGATDEP